MKTSLTSELIRAEPLFSFLNILLFFRRPQTFAQTASSNYLFPLHLVRPPLQTLKLCKATRLPVESAITKQRSLRGEEKFEKGEQIH